MKMYDVSFSIGNKLKKKQFAVIEIHLVDRKMQIYDMLKKLLLLSDCMNFI